MRGRFGLTVLDWACRFPHHSPAGSHRLQDCWLLAVGLHIGPAVVAAVCNAASDRTSAGLVAMAFMSLLNLRPVRERCVTLVAYVLSRIQAHLERLFVSRPAQHQAAAAVVTMDLLPTTRWRCQARHTNAGCHSTFVHRSVTSSQNQSQPVLPLTNFVGQHIISFCSYLHLSRSGKEHNGHVTTSFAPSSFRYQGLWGTISKRDAAEYFRY